MSEWIDISQTLSPRIAHWPGDTPFQFNTPVTKVQTGSVNIGKLTMSPHTGTHVDAPFHFDDDGETVEAINVNLYIGEAKMIDLTGVKRLTVDTIRKCDLNGVKRLLIKSRNEVNEEQFPANYMVIDEDVPPYLRDCGVRLVGVDAPSVDPVDSKQLLAHHALHANGIFILENIVLTGVVPGMYDLIALPLKIKGADGSPVRAVLRRRA